jgi:hypothetical protein
MVLKKLYMTFISSICPQPICPLGMVDVQGVLTTIASLADAR